MVGHRDRRGADVHRPLGVIDSHNALDHARAVPLGAQPGQVVPRGGRGLYPLTVGGEESGRLLPRDRHVRHGETGRSAGPQPTDEPPGSPDHFGRQLAQGRKVELLGDERASPVAAVHERPVEGHDEPDGTGSLGPLQTLLDAVPRARPIGLEERLRIGGDDLLDGLAAERTERHRRTTGGGGTGDGDLGAGMHGLHARR